MTEQLPSLTKRRPKNPTHRPRIDGFSWNVSTIAQALGLHRNTVTKRLKRAGVKPAGHVHNSPVYRLRDAMPAIYQNKDA